jgi:hypothetical protein
LTLAVCPAPDAPTGRTIHERNPAVVYDVVLAEIHWPIGRIEATTILAYLTHAGLRELGGKMSVDCGVVRALYRGVFEWNLQPSRATERRDWENVKV